MTLLLLATRGECVDFFDLQLRITSLACLLGPRLKLFCHWKAESLTFLKSSYNSFAEVFTLWISGNIDVGKKFHIKGQITWDLCRTLAWAFVQKEIWPLQPFLSHSFLKKEMMRSSSPEMLLSFNFKISSSC